MTDKQQIALLKRQLKSIKRKRDKLKDSPAQVKILRDAIIKIDKKSRDGDEPSLAERLISIDRITKNALIQVDAVIDS